MKRLLKSWWFWLILVVVVVVGMVVVLEVGPSLFHDTYEVFH